MDYQEVIKEFYLNADKDRLDNIILDYKEYYIDPIMPVKNEYELYEKQGHIKMYDYLGDKLIPSAISVFTLAILHQRLYSGFPHPDQSSAFRKDFAFLKDAEFELERPEMVIERLNKELFPKVNNMVKLAVELNNNKDEEKIIAYIDEVIELNAELFRLHPFMDANKRTINCFTNILFKLAGIPPVYLGYADRNDYLDAMNLYHAHHDETLLKNIFYEKICNTIKLFDKKKHISTLY